MLSPLTVRKSNNYRYRNSWKSNNFTEKAIKKRSKELIQKRTQRTDTKKDAKNYMIEITLQGVIEKNSILLLQN